MANLDIEARRAALRGSPLFRGLEPAQIDAVLAEAAVQRAARGAVLLRHGEPSAAVLVIVSGRVRIGVVSEDGRDMTLAILGPGDVMGEMSVLDGGAASADATAIEDGVLLAIERARFLRLLRGSADLCLHLMAVLCQRLRRSNAALEDMALQDLPTRLGRLVLRLARDYGSPTAHGLRIQVRLSQHDIAAIVGASREKVNRLLRQWQEEGIVGREAGHMIVLRPDMLAGYSALPLDKGVAAGKGMAAPAGRGRSDPVGAGPARR